MRRLTGLCLGLVALLLAIGAAAPIEAARAREMSASPAQACVSIAPAVVSAVFQAADAYFSARYPAIYGTAQVQRVIGDWALVVAIPKVPIDRVAVILYRVPGVGWVVVAGPGTAFPPEARPAGMPADLLEPVSSCG